MAALSVVDLAIWDLLGKIRGEPVYKMIGGRTKKDIPLYLTGPKPRVAKKLGFFGAKVPLPHGPSDGLEGIRKNVAFLQDCRDQVGPDYPIMIDCYMSLDVPYTISVVRVSDHSTSVVVFVLTSGRRWRRPESTSTGGKSVSTQTTLTVTSSSRRHCLTSSSPLVNTSTRSESLHLQSSRC